jgi:hypothetical protein
MVQYKVGMLGKKDMMKDHDLIQSQKMYHFSAPLKTKVLKSLKYRSFKMARKKKSNAEKNVRSLINSGGPKYSYAETGRYR